MSMTLAVILVAVLASFVLCLGLSNLLLAGRKARASRVRGRLDALAGVGRGPDIERHRRISEVPWLERALAGRGWIRSLDAMLEQGRVNINVGTLVLMSLTLGAATLAVARLATDIFLLRLAVGAALAALPFLYVRRRKNKRMTKFSAQLADALGLIGRALKAGHAFNQGMRMVADEFEDPIGPEFHKTLEEINFGVPVDQALVNLTERVDCPDLKFFVVSVNIQRETGGNLAEIVSNIAHLVRERFKFQGRVQVLAAEGKLTAYILLALPFAIGLVINLINPGYMAGLYESGPGRVMLTMAGVQMALGAVALKKLITIRV
ncbi:type II secretion system F family protein [Desulfocurvus sp. DL9XJH121]